MPNLFFASSNRTYEQITEVFDFLWPTAAAMWNLRWQVGGYLDAVPDASVGDLSHRFLHRSGIDGANLKRACIDHSWEQQQGQFSKLLLVNIFAIYEAWLKEVLDDIGFQQFEKSLQFPTPPNGNNGVLSVLATIQLNKSLLVQNSIYTNLTKNKKYSWSRINNLMKCYRYFKECRNCLMHNGGIADEKLENAYLEFATVSKEIDLGLKEVPIHDVVIKSQPIKVYLRGVVGLCDVIFRIITTLDAELALAIGAEKEILRRWKGKHGNKKVSLKSANFIARKNQIVRLTASLGYLGVSYSSNLEQYLIHNNLAI